MFSETRKDKKTFRRLIIILVFLLLVAGVLTFFIVSNLMNKKDNKGVFVSNTIQRCEML